MSTGYKPRCTRQHPGRAEVIISVARLQELERKERGHDDYLEAIRKASTRFAAERLAIPGYGECLRDLSQAIVNAAARRMQP